MNFPRFLLPALLAAVLLGGCGSDRTRPVTQGAIQVAPPAAFDELAMYGGTNRSNYAPLKIADEKFIAEVSLEFGSREAAARHWVKLAAGFSQQGDAAMAMRRLNQAWLLDPRNAQVYAAFGAALHRQGKDCEAMKMMNKALSLMPPTTEGIYTDGARIVALCAAQNKSLSASAKADLLLHSDLLFRAAEELEPNKGHVYASWANAYYVHGDYESAWSMVAKARESGADPGASFLAQLAASMSRPTAASSSQAG